MIHYEVRCINSKQAKTNFKCQSEPTQIFIVIFRTILQIVLFNCSSFPYLVSWLQLRRKKDFHDFHPHKNTPSCWSESKPLLDILKIFILYITTHLLGKPEERIFVKYIFSLTPCSINDDHNRWARRHHSNFFQIGCFSSRIQNQSIGISAHSC